MKEELLYLQRTRICLWKLQIAKKNKEKYTQEMEAYKQNKDEEAM
ncbi:hypothetical protein OIU76_017738, partial [Salix suchowensis]